MARSIVTGLALLLVQAVAPSPQPSFEALATGIGRPSAVVVDASGTVYVAAPDARRVFKIGLAGRMAVVAGGGHPTGPPDARRALNGDDGPAGNSLLSNPVARALGTDGNLYVADAGDRLVRRVDARTGIITTILGSPPSPFPPPPSVSKIPPADERHAEPAVPARPQGLAIDPVGNLYLSDGATDTVYRVKVPGGSLEAVAGSGLPGFGGDGGAAVRARLASPAGIALDSAGNLFIADRANHCVRRVDARSGVITTIAGDGRQGASGDGGSAAAARLDDPAAVAVDRDGNVFIADLGNARVRRVDRKTGLISTVPGLEGVACGAIAVTADGGLVVGDAAHWTVLSRNRRGSVATVAGNGSLGFTGDGAAATSAYLSQPTGLARDAGGNLYVLEPWVNRVRRIEAATGVISTFAGSGRQVFGGDGGSATAAGLDAPQGIACARDGSLVIADTGNHRVRRVTRDGTITTIAGTGRDGLAEDGKQALEAAIGRPSAVAFDGEGNLVVVQGQYGLIHRIDAAGRLRTIVGRRDSPPLRDGESATSGQIARIGAFAVSRRGDILFTDETSMRIWRLDAQTGIAKVLAGRGLSGPGGPPDRAPGLALGAVETLAIDEVGNLYVGDAQSGVRRVDAASRHVSALTGDTSPPLRTSGILFVEPGILYIADWAGYVWRVGEDGRLLKVAGGGWGF